MTGDIVNECIDKMHAADGILLGSPTYFSDVTAGMKALIERAGMTARANPEMLKRKVGAGVVAVRRAGAMHAFSSLNLFFLIGQMIVVGSNYWNIGIGREPGEVEKDTEGVQTMKTLGQNMAWLLKKLTPDFRDGCGTLYPFSDPIAKSFPSGRREGRSPRPTARSPGSPG